MDGHSNADDGQVFTFAQMHNRVEGAASGLAALGFGVGDVLSIHMPNHPDFYTALLAAVKLGGTVTTSNPVYTSRELHHQLTDSEARFALTTEELSPVVQQAAVDSSVEEVFVLGTTANWLDHAAEGTPTAPVDAKEHLAVLPYSSGTTGLPKGVMLSHYNIISNVCQYADCEGLCDWREDTKVLGVLPFFHIYGTSVQGCCTMQGCNPPSCR